LNELQSEWHKDIRRKFAFLISAELYLVSFVRPYPTTLRNFKQNFKNVTILRGFIFSWLIVMREGQKKAISLDKKLKVFLNV
jgi:hypothetical protein